VARTKYGTLANKYVTEFDEKWMGDEKTDEQLLGTADIQSLADLGNSYAGVRDMRIVPFGLRDIPGSSLPQLRPFCLCFLRSCH
jgi:hypothetical protein